MGLSQTYNLAHKASPTSTLLHTNYHLTKTPIDKSYYNALTQKLKRLLANLKSESYANYTSSLTGIDGSLLKPQGNSYVYIILHQLYVIQMAAGHYPNNFNPTYLPTTYLTHFNHTIILSLQPKNKKLKS